MVGAEMTWQIEEKESRLNHAVCNRVCKELPEPGLGISAQDPHNVRPVAFLGSSASRPSGDHW